MDIRFGFIIACLAILSVANAISKEYSARMIAAKEKCQKEFNVTDSVVEDFMKRNIKPESKSGKCMVHCIMEEMGMIDDHKINTEQVKLGNKEKWDDPALVELANQVADTCDQEVFTEGRCKCLVAVEYMMCLATHGDEVGLPHVDFEDSQDS
uniref:Odorant-binding protein 3 n=1 Tax=Adelphocoris lineolatus TaxID=236346 RepID=F4Y5P2_ADELI|nr:odorant-binding protein 3 [Adelphocoris lineolatus]